MDKTPMVNKEYVKEIGQHIKAHRWFIGGRDSCPYCVEVKRFLIQQNQKDIAYLKLEDKEISDAIFSIVHKTNPKWNTIPVVFYEGTFIGGYEETRNYVKGLGQKMKMSKKINDRVKCNYIDKYITVTNESESDEELDFDI